MRFERLGPLRFKGVSEDVVVCETARSCRFGGRGHRAASRSWPP
jgi:hypothetical protein